MVGTGICGNKCRYQGRTHRGGFDADIGQSLVFGGEQGQVVARDAALAGPKSCTGKALDQFRNIKPLVDGLFDIFDADVFIKADKGFSSLYRCGDKLGAPGRNSFHSHMPP